MGWSKKGISEMMSITLIIITALVILILLSVLFRNMANKSEEASLKSRCQSSVVAYARIKAMPFGSAAVDSSQINCPTQYVTISDAKDDDMKRQIADLMVDCWENYGEGKLNIFSGFHTYCAICYVFQFEDKSTKLTGLPSFLMEEPAPIIRKDYHPSYHEFITGDPAKETDISAAKGSVDLNALEGNQRYAILFTMANVNMWSKMVQKSKFFAYGTAATNPTLSYAMTKVTAGSSAGLITAVYDPEGLNEVGCTSLPVSQMDEKFK